MAIVTFETRDKIKDAIDTIPSRQKIIHRDLFPPETYFADYSRLLRQDIPYFQYTFQIVKDWYDADEEPTYIRAQQFPIDWKSKIGNSDMSTNFKTDHTIPIQKGNMAIREDGMVYMLNWNIQNHLNNQATQSIECNSRIEITRRKPEKTDKRGYVIEEEGHEIIAPLIPCAHSEYAGRPDYASAQGMPGINADHLITVSMQWNSKTKNIRINDEFVLGPFTYRIINLSIAEVNIEQEHGVLTLHAKRVAGGGISE